MQCIFLSEGLDFEVDVDYERLYAGNATHLRVQRDGWTMTGRYMLWVAQIPHIKDLFFFYVKALFMFSTVSVSLTQMHDSKET